METDIKSISFTGGEFNRAKLKKVTSVNRSSNKEVASKEMQSDELFFFLVLVT
jgi:hypothetical protein